MREIKFRFWDGENMVYTKPTKQKYDYEDGLVLAFSHEGYEDFNAHEKHSDDQQFEVMQYTGLKDKNGVEIYEGDIVQRGVIVFEGGKFQGNYYDSTGDLAETWEDDLCQEKGIEVLGNIYEHKHLLE